MKMRWGKKYQDENTSGGHSRAEKNKSRLSRARSRLSRKRSEKIRAAILNHKLHEERCKTFASKQGNMITKQKGKRQDDVSMQDTS